MSRSVLRHPTQRAFCQVKRVSEVVNPSSLNHLDFSNKLNDEEGSRSLQLFLIVNGLECFSLFADHLIRSFASCGCLLQACQVFLKIQEPTGYTWNAIISAHTQLSEGRHVFAVFSKMQEEAADKADRVTFLSILKVCVNMGTLSEGQLLHMTILEKGLCYDVVIGTALIHMYSRCGSIDDAYRVFLNIRVPNAVSWNTLISGYATHGNGLQALKIFERMHAHGTQPQLATYVCALKACGSIGSAIEGQMIHNLIICNGLEKNLTVASALIDAYGKFGRLKESHKIFQALPTQDVVSWSALISGYAQHGHALTVFELIDKMQDDGFMLDEVILLSMIKACSNLAGEVGRFVHDCIIRAHFESTPAVANSLVDMYARSSFLKEAYRLFNGIENHSVVSYSALISGFVEEGFGYSALSAFEEMLDEGIEPDRVILFSLLKACGLVGATHKGMLMHMNIIETGLHVDTAIGNMLVDMYGKLGCLDEANRVFNMLEKQDLVSWHSLSSGYVQQGKSLHLNHLLQEMHVQDVKPNTKTYTNFLSGCSHIGSVNEGYTYYKHMLQHDNILPTMEHYNCMTDLFGRVGNLTEAKDLLRTVPDRPNIIGWSALLSGCKLHVNPELGRYCFSEISQMDCIEASSYMMMSSAYSSMQMFEDAKSLQNCRKQMRAWKKPGEAWIEIGTTVYEFVVSDRKNVQDDVLAISTKVKSQIREQGYVPEVDIVCDLKLVYS